MKSGTTFGMKLDYDKKVTDEDAREVWTGIVSLLSSRPNSLFSKDGLEEIISASVCKSEYEIDVSFCYDPFDERIGEIHFVECMPALHRFAKKRTRSVCVVFVIPDCG